MTPLRKNWSDSLAGTGTRMLQFLPPELAHEIALGCLAAGALDWLPVPDARPGEPGPGAIAVDLRANVPGMGALSHPVGLAAGFDKNGRAIRGLSRLGFSHIEIGAVTPRAQPGNPRPRLFRDRTDQSLINRMGFNNDGAEKVAARLGSLDWNHAACPVGVNIGKNKDTPASHAIDDFLMVHEAFKDSAAFFVVNLSSPNTPGLRDLANPEFVRSMARAFGQHVKRVWIKFDPDMPRQLLRDLVGVTGECGFAGLVLTNTHRVEIPQRIPQAAPLHGGLSGRPLAPLSNRILEWSWEVHRGAIPTIGVGGIMTGQDAFEKIARGSDAVQIYTSFVYRGPWVVARMIDELAEEMRRRGFTSIAEARGSHYGA